MTESRHWTGEDDREQPCTLAQDCPCPECQKWNESHCEQCRAPLEMDDHGFYRPCSECVAVAKGDAA